MVMMAPEDDWTPAVALDALPEGKAVRVDALGMTILVLRSADSVFAVANRCTHQGAPLDHGATKLLGSIPTVTCPAHGSVFSLVDGLVRRGPATTPLHTFETRVNEGSVEVRPRI
jgi:nitrite reductase/ring-hydroxylating ferredoxin subunit